MDLGLHGRLPWPLPDEAPEAPEAPKALRVGSEPSCAGERPAELDDAAGVAGALDSDLPAVVLDSPLRKFLGDMRWPKTFAARSAALFITDCSCNRSARSPVDGPLPKL
mmetsp:Transcript_55437/g.153482  ORF Transcript_55437/g.153482 Transcript_55437/m.153482 type:complete len:109 (-) Transcript_55437:459-785(-)